MLDQHRTTWITAMVLMLASCSTHLVIGQPPRPQPSQERGLGKSAETRVWIDAVRRQGVQAKLLGMTDGRAILQKPNGQVVTMAIKQLSREDRAYLQRHGRKLTDAFAGKQPTAERSAVKPEQIEALPAPPTSPRTSRAPGVQQPPERQPNSGWLANQQNSLFESLGRALGQGLLNSNGDQVPEGAAPRGGSDVPRGLYARISGQFLSNLVRIPVSDKSAVYDVIMGTHVAGDAMTNGSVQLRLLPDPTHGSLEVLFSGKSDALTTGHRMLVQVHSDSTTDFDAKKRITFNAKGIHLYPTAARAETVTSKQSVSTELPGILGEIVGQIASQAVYESRQRADQEASTRAAEKISKRLDANIDPGIQRLHALFRGRGQVDAAPEVLFRTTADHLEFAVDDPLPPMWTQHTEAVESHDLTLMLPKESGKKLLASKNWLNFFLGPDVRLNETPLEPHYQQWSEDREWLTLAWDFDDEALRKFVQELAGPPPMPSASTPNTGTNEALRPAAPPGVYLPLR